MTNDHPAEEEKMELGHEPIPGYGRIFAITLTIASLYLAIILFSSI
jgi:hypothetical protein